MQTKANQQKEDLRRPFDGSPASAGSHPLNQLTPRFWGILIRRNRWGLSWRGWLIAVGSLVLAFGCWLATVHQFLAPTQLVDAKVLVIEGWVHDFAIRGGIEEFGRGSYQRVFTTGGPVTGSGRYSGDQGTTASVGASRLRALGMPGESIQMVPSRMIGRDRTYSSAAALREWFRENKVVLSRFNVVTEGVHARRTRLLFQKAFGKGVAIGVVAVSNPDYDAKHWWRYSEGVREVIGETIAYLYAKLFFHPSCPKSLSGLPVQEIA